MSNMLFYTEKGILCTGESLLFSQLTWSPSQAKWSRTMSLCAQTNYSEWARLSRGKLRMWMSIFPRGKLRMWMSIFLRGTRAASTTWVKTRVDRESPKRITLYWYVCPWETEETACEVQMNWDECMHPSGLLSQINLSLWHMSACS